MNLIEAFSHSTRRYSLLLFYLPYVDPLSIFKCRHYIEFDNLSTSVDFVFKLTVVINQQSVSLTNSHWFVLSDTSFSTSLQQYFVLIV